MIMIYIIVFLFLVMLIGPLMTGLPGAIVGGIAWFGNLPYRTAALILVIVGAICFVPRLLMRAKKKK